MTPPQGHLAEAPTAFERKLLEAARSEAPDSALEQFMLSAMTSASPGAGSDAHASEGLRAARGSWSTFGKWSLGVVSSGLVAWFALSSAPSAGTSELTRPVERPERAMAVHPSTPKLVETTSAREAAPSSELGTRDRSPPSKHAEPRAATPPPLHDELRLLERTRVALAQGRPDLAMSLLSLYERRHPAGQLRQEATVLRVQALDARGQSQKANALAEDFVEKNPHSAHAPRVARERGLSASSAP